MTDGSTWSMRIGHWKTQIQPLSDTAATNIKELQLTLDKAGFRPGRHDDARTYIMVAAPDVPTEPRMPRSVPTSDREAWAAFHRMLRTAYERFRRIPRDAIQRRGGRPGTFTLAWPQTPYEITPDVQQSSAGSRQFYGLVSNDSRHLETKLLGLSLYLAALWHVSHGGLIMHSSAVDRDNTGFLFLGDSGAGKSSVARFGVSVGHAALGDDINLVLNDGSAGYRLAAAPAPILSDLGYSQMNPILRAVFMLVQAPYDRLVPAPPIRAAQAVYEGFLQMASGRVMPAHGLRRAFGTACDIARKVPAFELHFRKTARFWDLIDDRFPRSGCGGYRMERDAKTERAGTA